MPVLDDLAHQYARRGLIVLAVNVEGNRKGYEKYIESNPSTHLRWARDGTSEISKAYRVRGLPTTYILDREGVIRAAHVGYGRGMEGTFRQEMEALLE